MTRAIRTQPTIIFFFIATFLSSPRLNYSSLVVKRAPRIALRLRRSSFRPVFA